jgi:hypothetical protein
MAAKAAAPLGPVRRSIAEAVVCMPTAARLEAHGSAKFTHLSFCHVSVPTRHSGAARVSLTRVPGTAPDANAPIDPGNLQPQTEGPKFQGRYQIQFGRHMESLPDRTTAAGTLQPCNLVPSRQPDRRTRDSVVGESHQIFVPNSVRRREATRSYHMVISA